MPESGLNPIGYLIAAVGLFALAGGLSDWSWFWNNSRARRVTSAVGRRGGRIVYVTIGILLILMGIFAALAGN
jgi:hypothetical protein